MIESDITGKIQFQLASSNPDIDEQFRTDSRYDKIKSFELNKNLYFKIRIRDVSKGDVIYWNYQIPVTTLPPTGIVQFFMALIGTGQRTFLSSIDLSDGEAVRRMPKVSW